MFKTGYIFVTPESDTQSLLLSISWGDSAIGSVQAKPARRKSKAQAQVATLSNQYIPMSRIQYLYPQYPGGNLLQSLSSGGFGYGIGIGWAGPGLCITAE